jgi:branched-chain amino acid aminotransferase
MAFINYNGKIFDSNTPIIKSNNRGLRYGDGLFETMKFKKNKIVLIDEHLARLWNGMKLFQFDLPKLFTPDFIENEILTLLKKNKLSEARIRLSVFRDEGGLYDAINHHPNFLIETIPLSTDTSHLQQNGLHCCFYNDSFKSIDLFCNLKHNNYLVYLMGALFAKKQKCNDAIILNQAQNVCDTTIANIFLIKDNNIYTPPLFDGCIAGVMRSFVISEIKKLNYSISEKTISKQELLNADEVFLTNSIYNIRWVSQVEQKTYSNNNTIAIYNLLHDINKEIFC